MNSVLFLAKKADKAETENLVRVYRPTIQGCGLVVLADADGSGEIIKNRFTKDLGSASVDKVNELLRVALFS